MWVQADIAWVLMSTALVMLMMSAFVAFFYGGLKREETFLNLGQMHYYLRCSQPGVVSLGI